jgi:CHAT domain-containing protein
MRSILFSLIAIAFAPSLHSQTSMAKVDGLINNAQFNEALQELDVLISQKKGDELKLQNRQALLLITLGRFDEAQQKLDAWLAKPSIDNFSKAMLSATKGYMFVNKASFDEAQEHLQKAMDLFSQSGRNNSVEAAQCLSYLATLFYSTGKLNQAEENQLMSLQIRQSLFPDTHPELADAYNGLGLVYSASNPEKALTYYEKAAKIYRSVYGDNHIKSAIASSNLGFTHRDLESSGEAINDFEAALGIWKKLYPDGHPNQAAVLMELGAIYHGIKNYSAAKAYFRNALKQYQKAYGHIHPDIATALNQLGVAYRSEAKYDSALFCYQQALLANSNNFKQTALDKNPKANSYYNGFQMLYSIRSKAGVFEDRYINKTIKQSDLNTSLMCLQVCDSLADLLRQNSRNESDKIALGAEANEVYEAGVRVALMLSEVTTKPALYNEIAFYFAEKSKSAVLLESIADANAKSFSGIPQELVEKEKSLKADIAFNSQKLAQKPDARQEQDLRKILFGLNGQYESFIKKLETDYPEYYNLKFNNAAPNTTLLRSMLPEGTAVVSYFVAESGKRLYIFTLSKNKFNVINRSLPEKFDRLVKGFNNSLLFSDPTIYYQVGIELSKALDPRVGASITDLVIIPSGRLGTLPFEALPLGKPARLDDFGSPYWVHRYSIGYEFSTTLLAQKSTKKNTSESSIFLCAPIQFSAKQNLNELPGTEAEVNFIATLFGKNVLLKKSAEATETAVKQSALKDYKYLHFATHGIVDESSPELSRIFLKESATDDGNLFSGEIYNLTLNADMVALSACQTGLGKVSKGEGVIGLSRALVYAGAKNIMVSYWSVSDESTSQLMTGFYQNALQSSTPTYRKNLQQVKIKMIADKKYGAPFYWAPFVLIGF